MLAASAKVPMDRRSEESDAAGCVVTANGFGTLPQRQGHSVLDGWNRSDAPHASSAGMSSNGARIHEER
jgi:hypothetical protein